MANTIHYVVFVKFITLSSITYLLASFSFARPNLQLNFGYPQSHFYATFYPGLFRLSHWLLPFWTHGQIYSGNRRTTRTSYLIWSRLSDVSSTTPMHLTTRVNGIPQSHQGKDGLITCLPHLACCYREQYDSQIDPVDASPRQKVVSILVRTIEIKLK